MLIIHDYSKSEKRFSQVLDILAKKGYAGTRYEEGFASKDSAIIHARQYEKAIGDDIPIIVFKAPGNEKWYIAVRMKE